MISFIFFPLTFGCRKNYQRSTAAVSAQSSLHAMRRLHPTCQHGCPLHLPNSLLNCGTTGARPRSPGFAASERLPVSNAGAWITDPRPCSPPPQASLNRPIHHIHHPISKLGCHGTRLSPSPWQQLLGSPPPTMGSCSPHPALGIALRQRERRERLVELLVSAVEMESSPSFIGNLIYGPLSGHPFESGNPHPRSSKYIG